MSKYGAVMTADHARKITSAVDGLVKREVLVDVPDGRTGRESDGDQGDDMTNAAIGYVQEFGSPAENIPARPFLIPGVQRRTEQNTRRLRAAALAALHGDTKKRNRQLKAAGQETRDSVKARIRSNIQPALSARTLAERQKRGKTSEHTLIDSGQLLNSINFTVRSKK